MQYLSLVFCLSLLLVTHAVHAEELVDDDEGQSDHENSGSWLDKITPSTHSVFMKRFEEEEGEESRYLLKTYRPNYILPYYYTGSPDYAAYENDIPDNQTLKHSEFKGQLSIYVPLWEDILGSSYSLQAAYTQLSYWQVYTESQWFRETDYEPELFLTTRPHRNWLINYGLNHQSNGRGGDNERSWNRAYVDIAASGDDWVIGMRLWALIFKAQSSDIHNPDIEDYLGNSEFLVSYKLYESTLSLTARNLERISHSALQATWSHPVTEYLSLYAQGFSGYGQSLIEYNHHTNSFGVGFALNDWI